MNQSENNEIDNLLRGLARAEGAASRAQDLSAGVESSAATSDHLDADELSAYAENALPEAARSRYTAHLADCGDCRQIVTQLSVAVGLPAAAERSGERETLATTWRQKVATLFAPHAWRYAMLALLLLAVVVAGVFALRQKREASLVAQNQPDAQAREQMDKQSAATAPAPGGAKTKANAEPLATRTHSPTPATNSRGAGNAGVATEASATPTVARGKEKDSTRSDTAADQPVAAAAPPPPPPAPDKKAAAPTPAKSTDEIRDADSSLAKNKQAERKSGAGVTSVRNPPAARKAEADRPRKGRAREEPSDAQASGGAAAGEGPDNETETRVVAGHRFQRQKGVWIDVAFDSSQAVTKLARGSDQYRALIADAPELRTIAEHLSGPVIVVWNGRAYRIQ